MEKRKQRRKFKKKDYDRRYYQSVLIESRMAKEARQAYRESVKRIAKLGFKRS